jgi:hypothetical protein
MVSSEIILTVDQTNCSKLICSKLHKMNFEGVGQKNGLMVNVGCDISIIAILKITHLS